MNKTRAASDYYNACQSMLGVEKSQIVSTWLDDENKDYAAIALFISENRVGQPIEEVKHPKWSSGQMRGYMAKQLFKINNIPVVFMPAMPDGMYFRKQDFDTLKRLAKVD